LFGFVELVSVLLMSWAVLSANFSVKPHVIFSRYLAGGVALRDARQVSRRQFFMHGCMPNFSNAAVADLSEATSRYNNVVSYLAASSFAVGDICYANRILNHEDPRAGIVRTQHFIHKISKNKVSLPAPEHTASYLNKALGQLSADNITPLQAAIYICANLLWLHPFSDGNGRTARALFDAIALKNNVLMISPFFFIFQQKNMQQHLTAVVSTASQQGFNISGEFWHEYADWHFSISEKVTNLLTVTQQTFSKKLLMMPLCASDINKANSLWCNPIINPNKQFFPGQILSMLLHAGVLSVKRTPFGPVYVCDFIISMYDQLDELLLSNNR